MNIDKLLRLSEGPSERERCRMCVVAATVGVGLAGAAISADASRSASNKQADAAGNAAALQAQTTADTNALTWRQYQQSLANSSPAMQSGQSALAALQQGLGLGQLRATGNNNVTQTDMYGNAIVTGNATNATTGQVGGLDANGQPLVTQPGSQNYGATQAELNQAAGGIKSGSLLQSFGDNVAANGGFTQDPSYQFRLSEGAKTLAASAAARGQTGSGQNLKDITNYSQGAASQEYNNAFNRYNTTQQNAVANLSSLAAIGVNGANAASSAGQSAAASIAGNSQAGTAAQNNYTTSGAAAQAAGQVGQANAWNSALNTGVKGWATLQGASSGSSGVVMPTSPYSTTGTDYNALGYN